MGSALLGALAVLAASRRGRPLKARPVTIVVPFAAGGGSDLLARLVAQKLEEKLGKPFIIENRPGAGTMLAAMQTVRAAPDGTTLMQATSTTMAINVSMQKKMPYEPLKDLVPVALLSSSPFFLVVRSDSPVKTVADLIALASEMNGISFTGSGGPGAMHHLSTELLQSTAGIEMTRVPYKARHTGDERSARRPYPGAVRRHHLGPADDPAGHRARHRGYNREAQPAAPDIPAVARTVPGMNPPRGRCWSRRARLRRR